MTSALKILPNYTYEDWKDWKGQWELIDGIPYAMSPAPVPKHQRIAASLRGEFYLQLKGCRHCTAYDPIDYKIAEDTIFEPDMLIVCGEISKKYLDFPPHLVAEIISPRTAMKDRHMKLPRYEQQGVKYCLLVSPEKEEVELYELINGNYELVQQGRSFIYTFRFEDCIATIDFNEIW
jgi:Uma2 family endonuclease